MFENKLKTYSALALIAGVVGSGVLLLLGIQEVRQAQDQLFRDPPGYTPVIVVWGGGIIAFSVPLLFQALDLISVARWWCVVFAMVGFGLGFGFSCVAIVATVLFATAAYYLQSHQAAHGIDFDDEDSPHTEAW